jgi:hypothetical protein
LGAVTDILKVFYAPHKVFKSIVKKPSYIAPLIVLILYVVVQFGSSYVVAQKSLIEQTLPTVDQKDVWTENATYWMAAPGVAVTENHNDYINASSYYNDTSIEFTESNSSSLQMAITTLTTLTNAAVNCGSDGFQNLSVRVKIVEPNAVPSGVTLTLYSLADANYFTYDLTSEFSNSSNINVWNNITVPVGSGSWSSTGAPDWQNITSLSLTFTWASEANIDLRVDGLFFRGFYETPITYYGSFYLVSSALNAVTHYLFQWLVLTAIMYLLIKGLKGSAFWKPLMIAVGTSLVILVVQSVVLAVAYATLPNIYYPLEVLAGVPGEFDAAYQVILNTVATVTLVAGVLQIIILGWNSILGTFVTREVTSVAPQNVDENAPNAPKPLPWNRCVIVSLAAVLITLVVLYFIGV